VWFSHQPVPLLTHIQHVSYQLGHISTLGPKCLKTKRLVSDRIPEDFRIKPFSHLITKLFVLDRTHKCFHIKAFLFKKGNNFPGGKGQDRKHQRLVQKK